MGLPHYSTRWNDLLILPQKSIKKDVEGLYYDTDKF